MVCSVLAFLLSKCMSNRSIFDVVRPGSKIADFCVHKSVFFAPGPTTSHFDRFGFHFDSKIAESIRLDARLFRPWSLKLLTEANLVWCGSVCSSPFAHAKLSTSALIDVLEFLLRFGGWCPGQNHALISKTSFKLFAHLEKATNQSTQM